MVPCGLLVILYNGLFFLPFKITGNKIHDRVTPIWREIEDIVHVTLKIRWH
jgi:hypothetical protein